MTDTSELERLAASITPGPWRVVQTTIHGVKYGGLWVETFDTDQSIRMTGSGGAMSYTNRIVDRQDHDDNDANAQAIAMLPDLLAEVIALRAEVERLESRATAADEAHVLLQRAVDLIRGDLVGGEWKKACNEFVKDALRALSGEKS